MDDPLVLVTDIAGRNLTWQVCDTKGNTALDMLDAAYCSFVQLL
jgi:hypothetical protein